MAISTDLIDNLTTAAINIVYFGFEITAGILEYIKDNYVTSIAGLVVLALLLYLVMGSNKKSSSVSSNIGDIKSMVKI